VLHFLLVGALALFINGCSSKPVEPTNSTPSSEKEEIPEKEETPEEEVIVEEETHEEEVIVEEETHEEEVIVEEETHEETKPPVIRTIYIENDGIFKAGEKVVINAFERTFYDYKDELTYTFEDEIYDYNTDTLRSPVTLNCETSKGVCEKNDFSQGTHTIIITVEDSQGRTDVYRQRILIK
jgi:hypothetical protein